MSDVPPELAAWHFVGGLLLGAYECPSSVPEHVTDERLQRIVEAAIGVWAVDGAVDVVRVGDTLDVLGLLESVGGAAMLHELIESWAEREERAQRLGLQMFVAETTQRMIRAQVACGKHLLEVRERYETRRADAEASYGLLRVVLGP